MRRLPRAHVLVLSLLLGALALGVLSQPAFAGQAWWQLTSSARPSYLTPNGEGTIVLSAINMGDAEVSGVEAPVIIHDVLPPGVVATSITATSGDSDISEATRGELHCSPETVSCSWEGYRPERERYELLAPYEELEVTIHVKLEGAQPGISNTVSIEGGHPANCASVGVGSGLFATLDCHHREEGGGYESTVATSAVPSVTDTQPLVISEEATPFGIAEYGLALENEDGSPDREAGSHPYQVTTFIAANQTGHPSHPPALLRNLAVKLPAGLIGDVQGMPRCTATEFSSIGSENINACPQNTAIGVATVYGDAAEDHAPEFTATYVVPVFNLVPNRGEPARFGFEVEGVPAVIDTSIRTGRDYGVTATVSNLSEAAGIEYSSISLWGEPSSPLHDDARGWNCVEGGFKAEETGLAPCAPSHQTEAVPFLTLPSACGEALSTTVQAEPWNVPDEMREPLAADVRTPPSLEGCGHVPFAANIAVSPELHGASTPTGLNVDVEASQEAARNLSGIADSAIRDVSVTLPEGFSLNPAAAGGLEACSIPQIGYQPEESSKEAARFDFTPTIGNPFCPNASKVGTVEITTPDLKGPLKGSVYLAAQNANSFGSLAAVYIVAEEEESGVLVKLPGEMQLNGATGQITTIFRNTPQAPVETIELHLFGGERAPLATPPHCGTYTVAATVTPWSGGEAANPTAAVEIGPGPNGQPCRSVLPLAPSLSAGTVDNQAGAFSPLTTSVSRNDGEQNLTAIQLTMAPGLSGVLTHVPLCAQQQANEGECGAESLIGETSATVGVGGHPYTITGGHVYITGPYEGAPFGLSIATPAKAGPYDLGKGSCDCIVVRARLNVDPHTAQLTITTDTSGEHQIPTILQGIPVHLRQVNVTVTRPGFVFNPTDCRRLAITGTVAGEEGSQAPVSEPFSAVNCATLHFAPKLTASVAGHASKKLGASLTTKLTYPNAAQGTQANISKVKVDLPIQLPSEQRTLNKACLAAVFNADPANCPPDSVVGHATVKTPVLPVALIGPAYYVSHGGGELPSLTMVLQGYGVTVELIGKTHIKKGVTSSTFEYVPDVPVSTFELTLPEGKFSALGANLPGKNNYNFCGQNLTMPTAFVGQNGAEIHVSTPISITGCTKHKSKAKTKNRH
jgi:hypothetical protein